jgi:hypothetical protein
MRWAKVVMIALGALIAFIVIESVFRLLEWAVIALVIGLIIAIAVKAHSQYKLARERRAEVKEEKATRKHEIRAERVQPSREITPAPAWTVESTTPVARDDVDAELARLKREMRS